MNGWKLWRCIWDRKHATDNKASPLHDRGEVSIPADKTCCSLKGGLNP
jgi:hypothetical protein